MSLLIKALATAEKDKQAELKKKRADEPASEAASDLALEPLQTGASEADAAAPAPVAVDIGIVKPSELSLAAAEFGAGGLSLQNEADSEVPLPAANKRARSNTAESSGAGKAEEPKAKSKADAFKAAAQASVATVKLQSASAKDNSQKVAASVFVANKAVKHQSSKSALILLGVAGALMIWLGLQGYQYLQKLAAPDVVMVKPVPAMPEPAQNVMAESPAQQSTEQPVAPAASPDQAAFATPEVPAKSAEAAIKTEVAKAKGAEVAETLFQAGSKAPVAENDTSIAVSQKQLLKSSRADIVDNSDVQYQNVNNMKQSAPLKLTSKVPAAGVDPTLLSAYEAFTRGDDAAAQQLYRQVLQADVRNVDALLGMAAIAQRQGRDADANGWYQKVLEIEPRNTFAQAAIASLVMHASLGGTNSAATDMTGAESRIKSMLAQQPEAASLHAALGNLYAAQNQWPSAQEAYFNASRFAPNNADFAFNLAVSLDHLGKSDLALAQYQRALDLLSSSGAASPDRAQLEARIHALQVSK